MDNKTSKIFEKTGCISSENLYRYANNGLTGAEKRMVEKHLVDCEMCHDELDGIKLFEKNEGIKEAQSTIEQKILLKYGHLKVKSNITSVITGIAASVLLAFVSGYIIIFMMHHFEKKEIAQQVETVSVKQEEEKPAGIVAAQDIKKEQVKINLKEVKETSLIAANKKVEKEEVEPVETIEPNIQVVEDDEDIGITGGIAVNESTDKDLFLDADKEQEVSAMAIPETKMIMQKAAKPAQNGSVVTSKMLSKSNDKIHSGSSRKYDLVLTAKIAFEQQEYKNTKLIIETAFLQGKQTDSLFYYYAVACFKLNVPDSTIVYLKKMKNPGLFQNGAKWFLSNAYLSKNEIEKAVVLLKEIANSKKDYSSEAAEKLSEISNNE